MIAPSVFIDGLSRGLIETLGPQALRAACEDAVRWAAHRVGQTRFRIGESPRQLRNATAAGGGQGARDTGLNQHLHLELTETAVLGDESLASAMLSQLRSTGRYG
jgi:EAL domain-containing protein (putative c-di-GMP-specific phosphodiesterase class I)